MLKILFVDHAMHRATESSAFFTDLLEARFEVSRLYVLPDSRHAFDWRYVAEFDVVVLWQMDFLAPLFLARGHRTVVIPMYDGSAALPQVHWASAAGAGFINFSRSLHERVRLLGLDSLLVKYFPQAVTADHLPEFNGLRVFLWQRRPEDGITADLVGRLFGTQLQSLHVHNVPDTPAMAARFAPPSNINGVPVSVSEWFANRADYYRVLESCNVFVCPRTAEGIGMAMVEAMARGMLVVANDLPSHNEYVCNWLNGVLFNTANVGWADFSAVRPIARMGWRTVRDGRPRWLASIEQILGFVAATPRLVPAEPKVVTQLQRDLVPAYLAGGEIYERFLLTLLPSLLNRPLADDAGPVTAAGVARHRQAMADKPPFPVVVMPLQTPSSASIEVAFGNGAARPILGSGWSIDEAFGVWIEGVQADLSFAAAIAFPVASLRLRIVALAPGDGALPTCLAVTVNGLASSRPVSVSGGGPRELHCEVMLPAAVGSPTWHLEFCCDRMHGATGDVRRLSVAIIALTIEFLPAVEPVETIDPPSAAPPVSWHDDPAGPGHAAAAALDTVVRKAARRGKSHLPTRVPARSNGSGRSVASPHRAPVHEEA
jgi:hypothetical protein